MKREFKVKCNRANYHLVKSILNTYYQTKIIWSKRVMVNDENNDYTEIWFKCSKRKLKECRVILRELVNTGVLLSTVEIW